MAAGNLVPLGHADGGYLPGNAGSDGLLLPVGKGAALNAGRGPYRRAGALAGGEPAGVLHVNGHRPNNDIAGTHGIRAGNFTDGSGERLKRGVQSDGCTLSHIEGGRFINREVDLQTHGLCIPDRGYGFPCRHIVPNLYINRVYLTSYRGGDDQILLAFQLIVVAALGLAQGDLRLLQRVGRVGAVNGIQHGALLHLIALLKIGGENAALDQGRHRVGVRRLQGPAAGDGGGDVHADNLGGGVGGFLIRHVLPGVEQIPDQRRHNHQGHTSHDKLDPAPLAVRLLPGMLPGNFLHYLGDCRRGGEAFFDPIEI